MHSLRRPVWLVVVAIALVSGACNGRSTATSSWLGSPDEVAPGVEFYRTSDTSLLEPAGPVAAYLLRLDPSKVRLDAALAHGQIMGAERVDEIAARNGAIAAVNGGFFNVKNGEPIGLLKVAGELVSDNGPLKGAVIIRAPPKERTSLLFDLIAARMTLRFTIAGRERVVPIDGVDTTRARGKLMIFTPAYHEDTDTAANGVEWILDGQPLRVVDIQTNVGRARIPRNGAALSFGGLDLPEALAALAEGTEVKLETTWRTAADVPIEHLEKADHIVNGAGLLRRNGEMIANWDEENLKADTFTHVRHPRTLIGVDNYGFFWLAAIDGRQPEYSVGMTFAELQRLADRLQLRDALNLDGGGSTTMVVTGKVVNRPSDPTGPRPVSDAIVVSKRD
ncbi:MAG TPA: phosphodiester glycosidase family protein [Vicinamibacterales bacterium]|nr:phosphodiester glycosidase family protein [Vicinamibacterales bacterium]